MGALHLKDLADRTRRGEEGRIRQGRAIGKPSYGYRMVRRLGAEQSSALETRQRELLAVERQIENLIDAIADGLRAPGLQGQARCH